MHSRMRCHEPSSFIIDLEGPVHLVRREALLRSRHQAESEKPFVSWDVAAVEDRAHPHSEFTPAWRAPVPALPHSFPAIWLHAIEASADWTIRAIRPADRLQLNAGRVLIVIAGMGKFDWKLHRLSPC